MTKSKMTLLHLMLKIADGYVYKKMARSSLRILARRALMIFGTRLGGGGLRKRGSKLHKPP